MSQIIISTIYPRTSNLKHEIQIRVDEEVSHPFIIYVNDVFESCHWIIDDAIIARDKLSKEYTNILNKRKKNESS